MSTIVNHDPLRAMVVWAAIAVGCSLPLAVQAALTLTSTRAALRWPVGLTSVGVTLGAVALAERAYDAAFDLVPFTPCYDHPVDPACEQVRGWIVDASARVTGFGVALLVATFICLILGVVGGVLSRRARPDRARDSAQSIPLVARLFRMRRTPLVLVEIILMSIGMFITTRGVAAWLQYAYLADITRAGDGIGELPFVFAVFGTVLGALVLLAGLTLLSVTLRGMQGRPAQMQTAPAQ